MNLIQNWTHSLLFTKNLYPPEAFLLRNVLGVSLYVASAPPLKLYLDGFFEKLKPELKHINHIQIIILSSENTIIEINTLSIQQY